MHFNIYIDDQIGAQLNTAAQKSGKTRNALIREAITAWLNKSEKPKWPEEILAFNGVKDTIIFESYRKKIKSPKEDPFA